MPGFADPLTGMGADRKLTKEELVRAIRFMVAAEYEAVEMYGKIQDATDDEDSKKVIGDIIEEERVHAGEFLALLKKIDPQEEEFYQKGEKEVQDTIREASEQLDAIATEIEPMDPVIARAIDQVNDRLEHKKFVNKLVKHLIKNPKLVKKIYPQKPQRKNELPKTRK